MKSNTNRVAVKKLLHSKWTAVTPETKEKHFMIVELVEDEQGELLACVLEAVHSKRQQHIDWKILKDMEAWQQGWH